MRVLNSTVWRCGRLYSTAPHNAYPTTAPQPTVTRTTTSANHGVKVFQEEFARQTKENRLRVKKVQVHYRGLPEDRSFLMNAHLSTPFDCARHIQQRLCEDSIVAKVDGQPWDMHKPFPDKEECELKLLNVCSDDTEIPNDVFWRSCSVMLGCVLQRAFKPEHQVQLCSFPKPYIKSGSFVYDVRLRLNTSSKKVRKWLPSQSELQSLSLIGQRLAYQDLTFKPLTVSIDLAMDMFKENELKCAQLASMRKSKNVKQVQVYLVGEDYVEISQGPLMSSTNHVGQFAVTAFHPINTSDYGPLFRVQGLAMPREFLTHFTTFDLLRRHAAVYNTAPLPSLNSGKELTKKTEETVTV